MDDDRITLALLDTQAGVVQHQRRLDAALVARREAVRAASEAGWSLRRIAEVLDVSHTAVKNILG